MLDREDIASIARGVAGTIRNALQAFETRLGLVERQASGVQSVTIRGHDKDRRSFILTMTMIDGRKMESEFKIVGSMQYREIHQSGRQYEIGDAVTHDGSMWVAVRDTAGSPGKSSDWRLAVKHGQDGKSSRE